MANRDVHETTDHDLFEDAGPAITITSTKPLESDAAQEVSTDRMHAHKDTSGEPTAVDESSIVSPGRNQPQPVIEHPSLLEGAFTEALASKESVEATTCSAVDSTERLYLEPLRAQSAGPTLSPPPCPSESTVILSQVERLSEVETRSAVTSPFRDASSTASTRSGDSASLKIRLVCYFRPASHGVCSLKDLQRVPGPLSSVKSEGGGVDQFGLQRPLRFPGKSYFTNEERFYAVKLGRKLGVTPKTGYERAAKVLAREVHSPLTAFD